MDGLDDQRSPPERNPGSVALLAVLAVPIFIVTAQGARDGIVLITGAAAITVVCLLCAYLSSRKMN